MVAVPTATPLTTPVAETVATVGLAEFHATGRSVRTVPFASFTVAANVVVCPITTLALVGAIVTELTGATVTTTVVEPLFPSLVAVIVAVPAATPVIRPADDTEAIALLLEPHVTTRFVTMVPRASLTVIDGVVVCATSSGMFVGDSVTLATGMAATVIVDDPLFSSLVAVMVAVPGATPVTTPDDDTVAIVELLVVHATGRLVTTVPLRSFTVTLSGTVCVAMTLAVGGVTVTVPTGTGITVTVIVPLLPSLVAVMVDEPSATPDTTPADETVAMLVLLDAHVTTRPVSTFPFASFRIGLNVLV
jgi:hypothetical protein